ncbi:MAG TPA: SRPBCC family protein [Opitutaceae bacterium]|nr:SRPBCC family protein [Opitutaceae bacterium]
MNTTPAALPGKTSERELVISRVIAAPRERVYQAWTRHLPEWWGPHGMTTPVCEMDLRPGGVFRTVMRAPDGKEYPTRGSFLEVVPNERIVFSDAYEPGWQPAAEHFMTAIVTFEALPGGKTKYTARALHKSAADREKHEQMGFHQGWGETIDRLAAAAAKI